MNLCVILCAAFCQVVHPDPEALAARVDAAIPALPGNVKGAYAKAAETQKDVVDILLAFDQSAVNWLQSEQDYTPAEFATNQVDMLNACLTNSLITDFTFRLADVVTFQADASAIRDGAGDVDFATILQQRLVSPAGRVVATGEWKKVTDRREAVGADIVSVLVATGGKNGYVGLGYGLTDDRTTAYSRNLSLIPGFGDWAYNVCSIESVEHGLTLPHEIAHNMGCGHPDASCASAASGIDLGPQLFTYSSGYHFWLDGNGYGTLMTYNFGGLNADGSYNPRTRFTTLPYFSSPEVSLEGLPLGTSKNDNRRTLLATYPYVAQYRASRVKPAGPSVFETEYRPVKAINGQAPYVGAVYQDETPVALVLLKCGKPSKSGQSKVSATVIGMDGKKKTSKAVQVDCGFDADARNLVVKDWGTMNLTLGGEGFVGTLVGSAGSFTVRSVPIGALPPTGLEAQVDFSTGFPGVTGDILTEALPVRVAVPVVGGKWKLPKAQAVKLAKDKQSVLIDSTLVGANWSGLKLSYAVKTATFKGSFKIFTTVKTAKGLKLGKLSVSVSGFVVDRGYGRAVLKKPALSWPMTIQ